jgi:hypothetical protein
MVGLMLESGLFPGSIRLASPCTSPKAFGRFGRAVKSSMWSFKRIPVPGTVTHEPKGRLRELVIETNVAEPVREGGMGRLPALAGKSGSPKEALSAKAFFMAVARATGSGDAFFRAFHRREHRLHQDASGRRSGIVRIS